MTRPSPPPAAASGGSGGEEAGGGSGGEEAGGGGASAGPKVPAKAVVNARFKPTGALTISVGALAWSFEFNTPVPGYNLDDPAGWVARMLRKRLDSNHNRERSQLHVRFRRADFAPGGSLCIQGFWRLASRVHGSKWLTWEVRGHRTVGAVSSWITTRGVPYPARIIARLMWIIARLMFCNFLAGRPLLRMGLGPLGSQMMTQGTPSSGTVSRYLYKIAQSPQTQLFEPKTKC